MTPEKEIYIAMLSKKILPSQMLQEYARLFRVHASADRASFKDVFATQLEQKAFVFEQCAERLKEIEW